MGIRGEFNTSKGKLLYVGQQDFTDNTVEVSLDGVTAYCPMVRLDTGDIGFLYEGEICLFYKVDRYSMFKKGQ